MIDFYNSRMIPSIGGHPRNADQKGFHGRSAKRRTTRLGTATGEDHVTWAHTPIILVIFLLGGFSGRFGGYGYGFGHGGIGIIGIILIILVVLLVLGKI